VIVNDGSSDGTAQAAAALKMSASACTTSPMAVKRSARNHALAQSRGEYIAFLDADDLFLPHHLACTVEYLQSHPERDAVYTDGTILTRKDSIIEPLSKRRRGPFEGDIFEQVVRASDVFGPPICIFLRHQRVITQQVWFDTRIVIGPDWDFLTRFAENNSFGYVDAATCLYRLHPTSISVSTNQERRRSTWQSAAKKPSLPGFAGCSEAVRAYSLL
jgi:glycosyltransferase involved in cell wall biosynthesis